jgi:hypothetical protein
LFDRIIGTWAVAGGISLVFTFFKQYRARVRYIYVALIGAWAILWGLQCMRHEDLAPRWALWLVFLSGLAAMVADSVRRYRETSTRLRRERLERLRLAQQNPSAPPTPGAENATTDERDA